MDAYRIENAIAQASIAIVRGKPIRIDDGRGIEVAVVHGSVWITQHWDSRDICIGTGESFRIERDGATLIGALKSSLVTLTLPTIQNRPLRVSMAGVGAKPVELFDTGSNPKPGRFDAWLERFWVRLFVPSARPTTAAL